jgi:PAS domain S-box-containing protein
MLHDVTERDANVAALAASEARFRTLAEVAPAGIFLCDATGDVSYVNPAWCDMAGITAEAARGTGWTAALHPDGHARIAAAFARHAAGGTIELAEIGFAHADGSERWAVSIAAPVAGIVGGFVGVTVDVTQQRAATEALRISEARLAESEARYRSLVESAADALVDIDLDGICRYVSPAVATVAGLDPDEIVNLSFWRYTHPDDVAVQRALLASLADGRAAHGSCQYRSIDTDGGTRWIEAILHGKRSQGGTVTGFIGAIRDVTEIVSVVAELELLQDVLDQPPPTRH